MTETSMPLSELPQKQGEPPARHLSERGGERRFSPCCCRSGAAAVDGARHWPKRAALMDESEVDVLAHMGFPVQPRAKLHSTNPIERLNKEVKRRADVVGIFPNEEAITRLIGAVLFEQIDEWQGQHRYMQVEAFSRIDAAESDPLLSTATQAA